ncbi:MAG TPA: type II CAAX endopeptidase family protein [Tepidisphaeraceae bacterium]|nr:type II CAAX endopeptidase family protein [Tepidisphaeraceae bacterium]
MSNPAGVGSWLADNWIILAMAGAAVLVAAVMGVFRRRSVVGPGRLDAGEKVGPLWFAFFFAFCAMQLVPSVYVSIRSAQDPSRATTQIADREKPLLGAAGAITAIVVLAIVNELIRPHGLQHLGLTARKLPRGLLSGAITAIIVLPWMLVAALLTKLMWDLVGLEHPDAHLLLRVMKDSDPSLRRLIEFSAIALAPISEEMLFRGHLQTAMLYTLHRARSLVAGDSPALPGSKVRWQAIVITSLIFALVHQELWLMPPIFFLSVCLGYVYERTGSLWPGILLHSSFNALNVAMFIYQPRH